MKYKDEYIKSKGKLDFIKRVLKKYDVSRSTAVRRYYDLRKKVGNGIKKKQDVLIINEPNLINNENIISEKPGVFKMLIFEDMKRILKYNTIDEMKRQGFTLGEIKWLKENKLM
jgi:hypothetical protein